MLMIQWRQTRSFPLKHNGTGDILLMFRVNKAKGGWLWVFALLEVSSLLCSKKSFSHRLLQVICGRGGLIWEYQNCRLRGTDGVQSLWYCTDRVGEPGCWELIGEYKWKLLPLESPDLKVFWTLFILQRAASLPLIGGNIVGFIKCLLFSGPHPVLWGDLEYPHKENPVSLKRLRFLLKQNFR